MVLTKLRDHTELGVHTELLGDGFVDLVEAGVVTGTRKRTHRNKIVTTTALGSQRLYDFVADNPGVEFWPVDYTNNPVVIAREPLMTSVNATLEVDFLGQCASESLGSDYFSSSGGQPDYARGASWPSTGRRSSCCTRRRRRHRFADRSAAPSRRGVTTFKNIVDKVSPSTAWPSCAAAHRERTRRLIASRTVGE